MILKSYCRSHCRRSEIHCSSFSGVKYAIILTADEAWKVLIKNNRDFMEIIHINMVPINGSERYINRYTAFCCSRFGLGAQTLPHLLKLLSSIFVVDSPFSIPLSGGKRKRAYGFFFS